MDRPLPFLAALSRSSIRPLSAPVASTTMSQVRFAISPARSPALADSSTITVLRRRMPGAAGEHEEVADIRGGKYFCSFAWHDESLSYAYRANVQ